MTAVVETPLAVRRVGIGQFVLASAFVLWLYLLGGGNFAWPVASRLSAVFLGTSFILRAFLGFKILREREWFRLRWLVRGNYVFLAVILAATFWHADEMNWHENIWLAHIWVLAYVVEPVLLPFLGPFGEAAAAPVPPDEARGPIRASFKAAMVVLAAVAVTVGGLLFINPEFLSTRWPWPLSPFDARVFAAWPLAIAAWAHTMALADDWAEIRMGVQALILYGGALFLAWLATLPLFEAGRPNFWSYGLLPVAFAVVLAVLYWRQERG